MELFRKPSNQELIQISLQAARQSLLKARIQANHYANEVVYQEGLIKLLEAQLEDKTITASDGVNSSVGSWIGQANHFQVLAQD